MHHPGRPGARGVVEGQEDVLETRPRDRQQLELAPGEVVQGRPGRQGPQRRSRVRGEMSDEPVVQRLDGDRQVGRRSGAQGAGSRYGLRIGASPDRVGRSVGDDRALRRSPPRGRRAPGPRPCSGSSTRWSCRARPGSRGPPTTVGVPSGRSRSWARRGTATRDHRSVRAPTSRRRFWPPESVLTRASALSSSPTNSTTSPTRRGWSVVPSMHAQHLRHREVRIDTALLQHDPDSLAQLRAARRRVHAQDPHHTAVTLEDIPRGSPRSSSCRHRWGRAPRALRPRRPRSSHPSPPRRIRRTSATPPLRSPTPETSFRSDHLLRPRRHSPTVVPGRRTSIRDPWQVPRGFARALTRVDPEMPSISKLAP